ncbi:MAG: hypothetical protein DHS20C02_11040 [Micavibrio sp.]|nr:MAG: hypothetical protein DHS20C02_11040 [Micavibrio sp.]
MRKTQLNHNTIASLVDLPHDREVLVARWQELYGTEPPRKASQKLLIRAVVYRMQEQAKEGLKPVTRRFLEQIAKGDADGKKKIEPPISIKPGTRLLREWHGITYEITVLNDGVQFKGRQYRSLSEVARAITGVRWSGPLFFGLKKKSEKKQEKE